MIGTRDIACKAKEEITFFKPYSGEYLRTNRSCTFLFIMVLAMILAHLVGDYILQTDRLAYWKSRDLRGVLAHGLIVTAVTALFALPFKPFWWQGVLFIGLTHTAIDAAQLRFKPPIAPVFRFFIDQLLHFLTLFAALAAGGYLINSAAEPLYGVDRQMLMVYAVGYAFVTMPAWVLLKFVGSALVEGGGPAFPDNVVNKYTGIAERVLILTVVLAGQYLLIPLLAMPRFIIERKEMANSRQRPLYLFESLVGITLAVVVGLLLRAI